LARPRRSTGKASRSQNRGGEERGFESNVDGGGNSIAVLKKKLDGICGGGVGIKKRAGGKGEGGGGEFVGRMEK